MSYVIQRTCPSFSRSAASVIAPMSVFQHDTWPPLSGTKDVDGFVELSIATAPAAGWFTGSCDIGPLASFDALDTVLISGIQPRRGLPCDPPPRPPFRRLPPVREPRRRTNGLSQKLATGARGTSSRSTQTSRTRASRARWSSSTLGALLLQKFGLVMASSSGWLLRRRYGRGRSS